MLVAAAGFLVCGSASVASARHVGRFDWAGFALLMIFMTASVSALTRCRRRRAHH
jgi:hypothetical protein